MGTTTTYGGGVGGTKVLISTITQESAGEFDFTNIPQTYSRLILEGTLRGSVSSTTATVQLLLNEDTTTSSYFYQGLRLVNGTLATPEAAAPNSGGVPGNTAPAGRASFRAVLESYTDDLTKTWDSTTAYEEVAGDVMVGWRTVTTSSVTSPVTRIRVRANTHPTDGLTGTLRLYGEM